MSTLDIASPFATCIGQCRNKMKKLRKKIYKNLKAKQCASPALKKKMSGKEVFSLLREEKVPGFVTTALNDNSGEDALQDITNIVITESHNFDQLRLYADEQERQVQQIIQSMHESSKNENISIFLSDQEQSTFNRMKSRRMLQSTEMQYEDEEIMDRHSKISLRPFELFPPDDHSHSRMSQGQSHLREPNGILAIQSHNYLQENIFPF